MCRHRQTGFTLIELMLAVAIMAIMGAMSWSALDVMLRTKQASLDHAVRASELQIALGQWATDLDQARHLSHTEPMTWDGKVFRLTRSALNPADGVVVVAWAVRADGSNQLRWMRWHSEVVTTLGAWTQAWEAAALWSRGGQLDNAVSLLPAQDMDIHVWSSKAWVSGLSSRNDTDSAAASNTVAEQANASVASNVASVTKNQPNGVRVLLQTPEGLLTKDWVNPSYSVVKS